MINNSLTLLDSTQTHTTAIFNDTNITFNLPVVCSSTLIATNLYTKTDIDNALAKKQNNLSFDGTFTSTTIQNVNGTSTINVGLNTQYMGNTYYTKSDSDGRFQTISGMTGYYSKTDSDTKFQTINNMSSYFTKDQILNTTSLVNYYVKSTVDNYIDAKIDASYVLDMIYNAGI